MHSKERPAPLLLRSSPNKEKHRCVGGDHWTERWDVGRRLGRDVSLNCVRVCDFTHRTSLTEASVAANLGADVFF